MKKFLLVGLAVACAAVMFTGCADNGAGSGSNGANGADAGDIAKTWARVVEGFEEGQDIMYLEAPVSLSTREVIP